MTTHTASRMLPYAREHIFDLVADVESYPTFLPFWRQASVYASEGNIYYTDQEIWMGIMQERFRTKTVLDYPSEIHITASEGIFRGLDLHWDFESTPEGGCRIEFAQSWKLRSFLKQQLLGLLLVENSRTVLSAFEKRACELYSTHGIEDGHSVAH